MLSTTAAPTNDTHGEAPWIGMAVAFLVAVSLYSLAPWFQGVELGFVNYDDPLLLSSDNPAIRDGLLGGLPELLAFWRHPQFMDAWLPLYYWSLALDHALFGTDPGGYHLHSVLLHGLGAALLVGVAARMGLGRLGAMAAGVLYAVHPVLTENVAWVASRKDVLSFAWMLGASWLYLVAVQSSRGRLHTLGAVAFAISLTAKATTLVLPLLLAVHALFLTQDDDRSRWQRLRPVRAYALVALVMTVLHLWVAGRAGTTEGLPGHDLLALLHANLEVIGRGLVAVVAPFRLSVEHGVDAAAVDSAWAALGVLTAIGWVAGLIWSHPRHPRITALLLAVPLALVPFNNVLPRKSNLFAERYVQIALLPIVLAVGAWLSSAPRSVVRRAVVGCVIVVLAATTWLRLPVWRDSISLWEDAELKAPGAALVHLNLASAYQERAAAEPDVVEQARWNDLALRAWQRGRSLAATPRERLQALMGLADQLFLGAGGRSDARERLERAVELLSDAEELLAEIEAPGSREGSLHQVLAQRATILELLGGTEEACADWEAAAGLPAATARTFNGLARTALLGGRVTEALEALGRSRQESPDEPGPAVERSRIQVAMGEFRGALGDLLGAIEAHPDDVELRAEAAALQLRLMQPARAEEHLRHARDIAPDREDLTELLVATLVLRADVEAGRGRAEEARAAATEAGRLLPGSAAPEKILGVVARRAGDLPTAIRHFRAAHLLDPAADELRSTLASLLAEQAVVVLDRAGRGEATEAEAVELLAEAVALAPTHLSTPAGRLDVGLVGWPATPDDPAFVGAWISALRGLGYLSMRRTASALVDLELAEEATRDGADRLRRPILELLSRARFRHGKWTAAVAAAEQLPDLVRRIDPDAPWGGDVSLARALIERGIILRGKQQPDAAGEDFDRARDLLARAHEAGLPASRLHVLRGEILFAEEKFLDATLEFDQAIEADPTDVEAHLDLAAVWRTQYLMLEDSSFLEGARESLERARRHARSDPRVLAGLGEVLAMQSRPTEAFPLLQRAVLADPGQLGARDLLASLIVRAGRDRLEKRELEEAMEAANRALALEPSGPDALLFLAEVQRAEGGAGWDAARETIGTARERFPTSPEPVKALGKFLVDYGHGMLLAPKAADQEAVLASHRLAVQAFREALSLEGADLDWEAVLGRLQHIADSRLREAGELITAGRLADAEPLLELSIAAEPSADAHFALGLAYGERESFDAARGQYAAAVALDPDHLDARLNHAYALTRLGRLDEGEAEYREFLVRAPEDHEKRELVERELRFIQQLRDDLDEERGGDDR